MNPQPHEDQRKPLDYARKERSPNGGLVGLCLALEVEMLILLALFELQRAPYRPPHDMTTLLAPGSIAFVRAVMTMIGVFWGITLLLLFIRVSRRA